MRRCVLGVCFKENKMPLTKKEQKIFEEMLEEPMQFESNKHFLDNLADTLFDLTGNVNLTQRLKCMADKMKLINNP